MTGRLITDKDLSLIRRYDKRSEELRASMLDEVGTLLCGTQQGPCSIRTASYACMHAQFTGGAGAHRGFPRGPQGGRKRGDHPVCAGAAHSASARCDRGLNIVFRICRLRIIAHSLHVPLPCPMQRTLRGGRVREVASMALAVTVGNVATVFYQHNAVQYSPQGQRLTTNVRFTHAGQECFTSKASSTWPQRPSLSQCSSGG